MIQQRRRLILYTLLGFLPGPLKAACLATEPNSLGPFYRKNAPFRTRLSSQDEPGQTLLIDGKVFGGKSCTPLPGAIVDVWHANRDGRYYDVGTDAGHTPEQFRLRGRIRANQFGEYSFHTVMPGTYGSRPRHVHYVVVHPDNEPLITQLYFEGDPAISHDFLARDSLVMPLQETAGGSLKSSFDIVLTDRS